MCMFIKILRRRHKLEVNLTSTEMLIAILIPCYMLGKKRPIGVRMDVKNSLNILVKQHSTVGEGKKTKGNKRLDIRPQCLFSSVVSTYRYNTVSFCKTKKKLPLQSPMLTECQSSRLHPSVVCTPASCSP